MATPVDARTRTQDRTSRHEQPLRRIALEERTARSPRRRKGLERRRQERPATRPGRSSAPKSRTIWDWRNLLATSEGDVLGRGFLDELERMIAA